jgi:hypothetical protein
MMCCKVLHIEELKKPAGAWCSHAVTGKGCGIYASRPSPCRDFYCGWMTDPGFGPEWKPEKAKFVVWVQPDRAILHIAVDPAFPDAWRKPPFYAQIKKWAVEGAAINQVVFVRIGARLIAVLSDREVDLGRVDPEDKFVVSQRPGPAGTIYDVVVKRGESGESVAAAPGGDSPVEATPGESGESAVNPI